jgi:ribonuclease D
LIQLSDGQKDIHLVQFTPDYDCPVLKGVLTDPARVKIFHFARFDLAMLQRHLAVETRPVYCTKVASKLARTYTDRHGLKDVVKEVTGKEISKEAQSSDWGAAELTDSQLSYAASDVVYLHALRERLDQMLAREGRLALAQACFDFLPHRAQLDLAGWDEIDIFAHS